MEGAFTHDGCMIKLTTHNHSHWKPMMEDYLIYEDLAEPTLNKNIPEGKNGNERKLLNSEEVTIIRQYIGRCLFEHL